MFRHWTKLCGDEKCENELFGVYGPGRLLLARQNRMITHLVKVKIISFAFEAKYFWRHRTMLCELHSLSLSHSHQHQWTLNAYAYYLHTVRSKIGMLPLRVANETPKQSLLILNFLFEYTMKVEPFRKWVLRQNHIEANTTENNDKLTFYIPS